MALDKIEAVVWAQPLLQRNGAEKGMPEVGEILQLILNASPDGDLLATTADGLSLRLSGLDHLAANLVKGEIIAMRVLSTIPRLQLSLLDRADTPHPTDNEESLAAIRVDQLALRQISRSVPNAIALAATWRTLVLGGLQQNGFPNEPRAPVYFPVNLLAIAPDAGWLRPPVQTIPPVGMESWVFTAYVWNGQPVRLRMIELLEDEVSTAPHRRRGPAGLRLEVEIPGLGSVAIQVQLAVGGVFLMLAAEQDNALRFLREALPTIATALGRINLRLFRCDLLRVLPNADSGRVSPPAPSLSSLLPPVLFQAAAEIVLVLSPAPPPGPASINP